MADHSINHIEISTTNPTISGKFYKELFGWNFVAIPVPSPDDPNMVYHMYSPESGASIAFSLVDNQMVKAGQILPYFTTADVEGTLAQVSSLGGKTILPKMEIPGGDFIGIFSDPVGNLVGVIEQTHHAA
ncbi:MAG: VOC family protein [Chloroflexi bacterium]|uniref:VOC family protein n=1 Tax=Candidatus Chlorohelix allophototropha TaxID=3003348 RepID=A0A8T7M1E1_9CHLR|nr:VOC family protein [Chloroflexota bacterium]WJW67314.1 VOC family protein [Chloroflexota bacterium L227-S17]